MMRLPTLRAVEEEIARRKAAGLWSSAGPVLTRRELNKQIEAAMFNGADLVAGVAKAWSWCRPWPSTTWTTLTATKMTTTGAAMAMCRRLRLLARRRPVPATAPTTSTSTGPATPRDWTEEIRTVVPTNIERKDPGPRGKSER